MKKIIIVIAFMWPLLLQAQMPDRKKVMAVKKACESDRQRFCKSEIMPQSLFSCLLDHKEDLKNKECSRLLEELEKHAPH